jgi:glucan phosphoethanolaminetransferase (alkaline phosphatase superfamily)
MDVLIRFLLRFIVVPLGAAIAFAAGLAFVVIAHRGALRTLLEADPQVQEEYLTALFFGGPLLALLLSIWTFYVLVPAAIGVLVSETFAIRSWIFHAANGALAAWLGWAWTQDIRDEYRFLTEPRILVAAGLVAGLAYWLVAGSTAGFWKPIGLARRPGQLS